MGGNVYVNPPYNSKNIKLWIKKAYATILEDKTSTTNVVMLLPSRTDTKWFHEYIWHSNKTKDGIELRLLKGRLRFEIGGQRLKANAAFPSLVVIFRPKIKANSEKVSA